MTAPALALFGLGKDYGARTAVHAIDLEVPPGQIFGLLGPNGAGKTTTISMACGVTPPTRGRALVCGLDVWRAPMQAKAKLGLVPQELAIYQELDATENLTYFGSLHGLRGAERAHRVDWALKLAGLADRAREPTARFSGGMKRRLNLAAGLVHRPALLVLDEPTVGVDPQSRNHVFETVRALADDGMAIIYTSHYMEEVEALCHRLAIVDDGRIVAAGSIPELLAAHAPSELSLELRTADGAPFPTAAAQAAAAALCPLTADPDRPGVVLGDAPAALAPLIAALEGAGARVARASTTSGTLETVFLRLTGKALRDGQEGA